jgi:hypothetical protein
MVKKKSKAKGKLKSTSPVKKVKPAKSGKQPGQSKFKSAKAVFDHLGSAPQRVKLTGTLQRLDDDQHVAFTPNGTDWVALPVSTIDDAKLINRAANETAGLDCIEITVCLPPKVSDAALKQVTSLNSFSELTVSPPSSPPPICPGGIARWVGDHWECI